MINQNFVILGALFQLIGIGNYIKETIQGKIKPNKVSWLLWSIAPLIAFFAEFQQGVGLLSLTTFIVGFSPLLVFLVSFLNKKSEWKLSQFDYICGGLSVLGLIFWGITKVGNIAIFFSILADGLAALPTIVKSYNEPQTENYLPFSLGVINAGIGFLVIKEWNFQSYGFPVYLLIVNALIAFLIMSKIGKK